MGTAILNLRLYDVKSLFNILTTSLNIQNGGVFDTGFQIFKRA